MAPVTDVMLTSSNMAGDFRKINLRASVSSFMRGALRFDGSG